MESIHQLISSPLNPFLFTWNIQVYPNGYAIKEGTAFSMYLTLNGNEKFRPYEKIYVRGKLRVLNQRNLIDNWHNGPGYGPESRRGYDEIVRLDILRNSSRGFLVKDVLKVQVELEAISSTKYFSS